MEALECRVLGPLEILRQGRPVALPPKQRDLLALLALRLGAVVSVDELLDELWGEAPPRTARTSLQNAVSGLRKALLPEAVVTVSDGYRLDVGVVRLDALRFESLVNEARSAGPEERAALLREALACWRGAPLTELSVAWAEIARLAELRLTALEERIEADLTLGSTAELVPELEGLVRRNATRERLWSQLMRALYLSGRQAEALATYRRAHEAFVTDLGIEPGPALKELQLAMLLQDHRLEEGGSAPSDVLARAAPLLPTRTFGERAESLLDYAIALWRIGNRSRAISVLEHAESEAGRGHEAALTVLITATRAQYACVCGEARLADLTRTAEDAATAIEAAGDGRLLAKALAILAVALRLAGRMARAAETLERAVDLAHEAGDPWQEGWCRNHYSHTVAAGPMPVVEALGRCEDHLAALEWGPPGPLGIWVALGLLHSQAGDADLGRNFAARAVEGARASGVRYELAWARTWLAITVEANDPDEAEEQWRRAHDLFAAPEEDALALPSVRAELARHAVRREALDEAAGLLAAAQRGIREEYPEEQFAFHRAAALLEAKRGNAARAVELAECAVDFARQTDELDNLAAMLETVAKVAFRRDALAEARSLYEQRGNASALARVAASLGVAGDVLDAVEPDAR